MRVQLAMVFTVLTAAVFTGRASGQAPSAQTAPTRVIGEVTALMADSGQIVLKTDKGDAVTVVVAGGTAIRRVPPGARDLTAATRIDLSSVGLRDRVLAIGQVSGDGKKVDARSVIVMSRADLNQKQQAEHEDWKKRGLAGTVSSLAPEGKAFTITSGSNAITIRPGARAEYRRYAPDSVKFSDARPSSLAEIQTGDLVRVLGDRSADGSVVIAERIVFGSFRQSAATITSLSAETAEITVKDLATKKTVAVRVNSDSIMRRLPPELEQRERPPGSAGEAAEV